MITCHHTRLHLFHSTRPGALSLALTAFHSLRPPVSQSLVLEFGDLIHLSPRLSITWILPCRTEKNVHRQRHGGGVSWNYLPYHYNHSATGKADMAVNRWASIIIYSSTNASRLAACVGRDQTTNYLRSSEHNHSSHFAWLSNAVKLAAPATHVNNSVECWF